MALNSPVIESVIGSTTFQSFPLNLLVACKIFDGNTVTKPGIGTYISYEYKISK